jgi:hypothetical protein
LIGEYPDDLPVAALYADGHAEGHIVAVKADAAAVFLVVD